jgi:signal transduction histidine kinase
VDTAFELTFLAAGKLIAYSFGALTHLFLMVLILGQRRLGRLEWLLFALMSGLFMWNSGNLLTLNVALAYGMGPTLLARAARLVPLVGFLVSVPILVHVHFEYAFRISRVARGGRLRAGQAVIGVFYLPLIGAPWMIEKVLARPAMEPASSLHPLARPLIAWLVLALLTAATLNAFVSRAIEERRWAILHRRLAALEAALAAGFAWIYLFHSMPRSGVGGYFPATLMAVSLAPSLLLGYSIVRYNFLDFRVQRNLIYSVVAIFALLLYIDFIRRLSGYLDDLHLLPAAVTEAVMIFVMVVFLEPVKKRIDRLLQTAFQSEFGRVQKLATEVQNYAKRTGDLEALERFIEERLPAELDLNWAKLELGQPRPAAHPLPELVTADPSRVRMFPIRRGAAVIGVLEVALAQTEISGDYLAALELLADQLAAAIELCQLIADKVHLERALAEKAKLAFLGEMAARIAHNVKNPLSSMKTLVQLLEEDATLPERARQDCRMVVAEIDRLNLNISQVLRYAKPARDLDRPVDLSAVVNRVVNLTRLEAERRQVKLDLVTAPEPLMVGGGDEAASDIVSNLVVNALEASPSGATVRIGVRHTDGTVTDSANAPAGLAGKARSGARPLELFVEDEGSGVSGELRHKIFQPFFTTRPGGTGLGLAIVARRAEEIGGAVVFESPLESGKGTRFVVRFQTAESRPND